MSRFIFGNVALHCNLRFYLDETTTANQTVPHKQQLMRSSIITGGPAQEDEHISVVVARS